MKSYKEILRKNLSNRSKIKLLNAIDNLKAIGFGNNLDKLAGIYKTDKTGEHSYAAHYQSHFKKFKYKKIKLLEIGAGCYENPFQGSNSLRMWKKYFPFAKVFAIDYYDKSLLEEKRIKIFRGNVTDKVFLEKVADSTGTLDIIIDDASHINNQVIETFIQLFPNLKDGGIYVVEDTQTSYWKEFGGDSSDLNNPGTIMNFFKSLTDSLNNKEFVIQGYKQSYFDKNVVSIHFYHNLIMIYKGKNTEESNILINNQERSSSQSSMPHNKHVPSIQELAQRNP